MTDRTPTTRAEYQKAYERSEKGKATQRRYHQSVKGKAVQQRATLAWEARNADVLPIVKRARMAVWRAVKAGRLVRTPCHCGETKVEGHHHKGYGEAHKLDVVWLCAPHHHEVHQP